eukprot:226336_1
MSVVKNPSKVYIGNIPRDAEEGQIEKMFDEVGNSLSLEFKGDFAFVEYADAAIAEEAIRKFDGIRIRGRRLIVEPFRYRGGDPRYRRPPPKNVTRGEYRCIVTNLSGNTSAQDLRDWVEHEKLLSLTVTDVYNRHGLNEGVVEFQEKGDWDYMIRTMDRVKLDSHYVRVYDEREYNRRKLKVYDRPQGNKSGGRDRNRDRDRDRDRERPRSRSYSKGRGDRNRTRMQRNYRDNDRMNNRISNRSRDREPHREIEEVVIAIIIKVIEIEIEEIGMEDRDKDMIIRNEEIGMIVMIEGEIYKLGAKKEDIVMAQKEDMVMVQKDMVMVPNLV